MKKVLTLVVFIVLLFSMVSVSAQYSLEDIENIEKFVPSIQYTDIKVFFCGKEIPAVSAGNELYIPADDLIHYGFDLFYNNDIRTLFIKYVGENDGQKVGNTPFSSFIGTDIKVFLNGIKFEKVYVGGNKTYISANALCSFFGNNNVLAGSGKYGYVYGFKGVWDGKRRAYFITPATFYENIEEHIVQFKSTEEKFGWKHIADYTGDGFTVVACAQTGTPHGNYITYNYYGNDGRFYSVNSALRNYGFYDAWGHVLANDIEISGESMYFSGHRTDGRTGEYILNLNTWELTSQNETERDSSKATVPFTFGVKPYEGNSALVPSFKVYFDGMRINAAVVKNVGDTYATFIDSDVLLNLGFSKKTATGIVQYFYTGEKVNYIPPKVAGKAENWQTPIVYIGDYSADTLTIGSKQYINAEFFEQGIADFSATWDGSLKISYNQIDSMNMAIKKASGLLNPQFFETKIWREHENLSVISFYVKETGERYSTYVVKSNGFTLDIDSIVNRVHGLKDVKDISMKNDLFVITDITGTYLMDIATLKLTRME